MFCQMKVPPCPTPFQGTDRTPLLGYKTKTEGSRALVRLEDVLHSDRESQARRCLSAFMGLLMFSLSIMGIMTLAGTGPWAVSPVPVTRRVAIIGAGASGSSAAYHLARFGPGGSAINSLEITVFERSHEVGGRCMAVDVPTVGQGSFKVELGSPGYNIALDHLLSSIVRDIGMGKESIAGGRWAPVDTDFELGM